MHSAALPHDPFVEVATDVFLLRSGLRMNPLVRISRNMTVLRQDGELSLVNPVRLDEDGIAALQALGRVRRIIALGAMHGIDDAWYRERFAVQTWVRPGSRRYPAPPQHEVFDESRPLPIADARLLCFGSTQPESALLLARGQGLLLTCDAVQHYGDYRHCNLPARLLMPFIGFPKTTLIGPIWLQAMTPAGGSLRADFERLLEWRFDSLLSAHGSFLATGAHAAVRGAVDKAFS